MCRCSVVNASVSLTRAKLRALQVPQRKASLPNQKQRLCRHWAQQKARAALIKRLAPACVAKQETGSFYNIPPVDRIAAAANQVADATESE